MATGREWQHGGKSVHLTGDGLFRIEGNEGEVYSSLAAAKEAIDKAITGEKLSAGLSLLLDKGNKRNPQPVTLVRPNRARPGAWLLDDPSTGRRAEQQRYSGTRVFFPTARCLELFKTRATLAHQLDKCTAALEAYQVPLPMFVHGPDALSRVPAAIAEAQQAYQKTKAAVQEAEELAADVEAMAGTSD